MRLHSSPACYNSRVPHAWDYKVLPKTPTKKWVAEGRFELGTFRTGSANAVRYSTPHSLLPVSYSLFKTLNKQLYQLHQSWFTITATCVWVKLGIVHFGINAPSLWCIVFTIALVGQTPVMAHGIGYCVLWHQYSITFWNISGVWYSLVLLARYTHILCTLMVHLIGYSAMTSIP